MLLFFPLPIDYYYCVIWLRIRGYEIWVTARELASMGLGSASLSLRLIYIS